MPARFQEVAPGIFADVAHNPAKTRALATTMGEALADRHIVLVLGITERKDHRSILRPLASAVDAVVFTKSRYRGVDPGRLCDIWVSLKDGSPPAEVVADPRDALRRARDLAGEEGAVVVTGSTFVVDEALNPEGDILESNATYRPPGEASLDRNPASDA
jgi:dihydrofolate synthase/folylpolyglutamate synthase